MPYSKKSFMYDRYSRLFYTKFERNFDNIEESLMIKFTSIEFDFGLKKLFYNSIYRMKRWYPKIIVYILIYIEFYIYFKKNNASKDLLKAISIFSKLLLCDTTKGYCRPHYKYEK